MKSRAGGAGSAALARLLDGLRANLKSAGIPAREEDIEQAVAGGCLERVLAFRRAASSLEEDLIPDAPANAMLTHPEAVGAEVGSCPPEVQPGRPEGGRRPSTIAEAAPLLRGGAISPVELTERALARIEERDGELNAFHQVFAEPARAAARKAEDELARGARRGPLHGIPVAVKDLLAMKGTETAAGSKVFSGRMTGRDATVVERLRKAGAIIIGKTRLSEFAYWPGSTNPHFGPTANPHDPTRDAGGSSSGSAAAVAAGMVYAALGTDTGGSIRIPAALCGVVGLKPTFGRCSLDGCVPLAWSLDHVGPLTRSAGDAALVLAAIAGTDARDPRTAASRPFAASGLGGERLSSVRVGIPRELHLPTPLEPEALSGWEEANRKLEDAGATTTEVVLDEIGVLRQVAGLTLGVEAAAFHVPLLRTRYDDYGAFCRGRLLGTFTYSAGDFLAAQRLRRRSRTRWNALFRRVDLLSLPCQPAVAPFLDMPASTDLTNPFNALGWPALSVPCGSGEGGLPLGIQLVGKPWDELTVLRAAQVVGA